MNYKNKECSYSLTFVVWFIIAILLLVYSIANVSADSIQILDSDVYNWQLDLRTTDYLLGRTLIQDGIITSTCEYKSNSYGCAIQVPLTNSFNLVTGKQYTFTFLVSTDNKVLQTSTWKNNLVVANQDVNTPNATLWRMYNYTTSDTTTYNASVTITPQDTSSSIKIYRVDYTITSKITSSINVIAFAFGENFTGTSTSGVFNFSYLMVDATNDDVINALDDFKNDVNTKFDVTNRRLDDINNSINSEDDDTTSNKCGVICKLKGIFTGIVELPSKIANAIKGLFVPDNFDFINDFKDVMISKLGILGQVPDMLLSFLNDIINEEYVNQCFTMPVMSFFGYSFWNEMSFCVQDSFYYNLIKDYRWMTNIIPVFGLIFYCFRAYKNFFGGDDTE